MGIGRIQFDQAVGTIQKMFGFPGKEIMDLTYDELKWIDEWVFKDACRELARTYRYRRFPYPADFYDAVSVVEDRRRESAQASPEDIQALSFCHVCSNSGFELQERATDDFMIHTVAVYCSCPRGQSVRMAHRQRAAMIRDRYFRKKQKR